MLGCTDAFEKYDFVRVRLDAENFFWHEFCDEYLELVKDRMYNSAAYTPEQVNSAKYATYTALLTILKLFAPIMPHITEEIFNLYYSEKENVKSIHLSGWPAFDKALVNPDIEELGGIAVELVSEVRKFKSGKGMSLKVEIAKLIVECDEAMQGKIKKVEPQIKATAKVRGIFFEKNDGALNTALAAKVKIEG